MDTKNFYITTPLFYVNDKPHLGTAYCVIMADVISRYYKLFNDGEVYFLTGTDEHGQKCEQAAKENGLEPKVHCDKMVNLFKNVWHELQIDYNFFFRTTDSFHKKSVQNILQNLFDRGEIYKGEYEGWYSVSEELFYTQKDLVDGRSPTGKKVQKVVEEGYFFRMSKYQKALIKYIKERPNFILPVQRRNEVLGFLKSPLNDLNISRPKKRLQWGIELPFDSEYVCYVWFDALLNYATAVGLGQNDKKSNFEKWWNQAGARHLIGKDILITHAVYWPTLLMALNCSLPKQIFSTGWILNKESEKMSKSIGDVVNPLDIKNAFGSEVLRYFFVKNVPMGKDAPFSFDLLKKLNNSELSNNLGNLVNRVTALIHLHFNGKIPALPSKSSKRIQEDPLSKSLIESLETLSLKVKRNVTHWTLHLGLESLIEHLNQTNRFLGKKEPWKMVSKNKDSAGQSLALALESIRVVAILLSPILPKKCEKILEQISCKGQSFIEASQYGLIKENQSLIKNKVLFPRL